MPIKGFRIFGKSTQDGVPSPENPVPIVNVGGKGNINTEIREKNFATIDVKKYSTMGWTKTIKPIKNGIKITAKNGWITASLYIPFLVKKEITISFTYRQIPEETTSQDIDDAFCIFNNDNNAYPNDLEKKLRINSPSIVPTRVSCSFVAQKAYLGFFIRLSKENLELTRTIEITDFQIELGNKETPYTPYAEPQTLIIQTPNGFPGIKADYGGNYTDSSGQQWISDEIDLKRGKYVQRNLVFEPNIDNVKLSNINDHNIANFYFEFPTLVSEKPAYKALCNRLRQSTLLIADEKEEGFFVNKRILYIRLKRDVASTEDEFKTLFKDKPIKVVCKLETSVEHDLTPEEIAAYKALHTNHPTTIVSNDENADMELTYTVDTRSYVDTKIAEVSKAII